MITALGRFLLVYANKDSTIFLRRFGAQFLASLKNGRNFFGRQKVFDNGIAIVVDLCVKQMTKKKQC